MKPSREVKIGDIFWITEGGNDIECSVIQIRKIWRGVPSYIGRSTKTGEEYGWYVGPIYETNEELKKSKEIIP